MLKSSTLKFLKDLKKNNNKPWFDEHRDVYEAARDDFANFIQAVLDKASNNDTDLKALTAKQCMFRINRDVRFAKDKSPYKTNFGASMDKGGKKSGLAGYYFHCEPGQIFNNDIIKCTRIFSDITYGHRSQNATNTVFHNLLFTIYPETKRRRVDQKSC